MHTRTHTHAHRRAHSKSDKLDVAPVTWRNKFAAVMHTHARTHQHTHAHTCTWQERRKVLSHLPAPLTWRTNSCRSSRKHAPHHTHAHMHARTPTHTDSRVEVATPTRCVHNMMGLDLDMEALYMCNRHHICDTHLRPEDAWNHVFALHFQGNRPSHHPIRHRILQRRKIFESTHVCVLTRAHAHAHIRWCRNPNDTHVHTHTHAHAHTHAHTHSRTGEPPGEIDAEGDEHVAERRTEEHGVTGRVSERWGDRELGPNPRVDELKREREGLSVWTLALGSWARAYTRTLTYTLILSRLDVRVLFALTGTCTHVFLLTA